MIGIDSSILLKDKYQLPIIYSDKEYLFHITNLLNDYINDLISEEFYYKINININELELIRNFVSSIIKSINELYNGYPSKAYIEFKKAMNTISNYLMFVELETNDIELYRIRTGSNDSFIRDNIFHVPFQLRGKISTNRYSILGFPALYLGSSAYVCWEELSRPNFFECHISRYYINKNIKVRVLDFGYRPIDIYRNSLVNNNNELDENNLKNYYFIWPLLASCSYQVKSKNDSFKPEYIVPQLLMEWLRQEKSVDGLRYFSLNSSLKTNYLKEVNPIQLTHNYVFPAKSKSHVGYCLELVNMFQLTNPLNWQLALSIKDSFDDEFSSNSTTLFQIYEDHIVKYGDTQFGKIEILLSHCEKDYISFGLYNYSKNNKVSPSNQLTSSFPFDLNKFGNHLKIIRKSQGLSQLEVSSLTGINSDTLRRLENGLSIPRFDTLELLSDLYGLNLLGSIENFRVV